MKNMNRRNFLKSSGVILGTVPSVASVFYKSYTLPLERVGPVDEFVDILTIDELNKFGIRSAIYSAGCVDKNGIFAYEYGYDHTKSEPFCRMSYVLRCLPKIWSNKKRNVYPIIEKIKSGDKYSIHQIINEVKEHMEYVCIVGYALAPCLCGSEKCLKHYIPVMSGVDKIRYNRLVNNLNNKL